MGPRLYHASHSALVMQSQKTNKGILPLPFKR